MIEDRSTDLGFEDLARRWWRPAIVAVLVVAAVVWRLVKTDLGAPPNLELSTMAAFAAAALLRHRMAVLVPVAIVLISDLGLTTSWILLFTWSAWLMIGLGALRTRRTSHRLVAAVAFGAGSSLAFYLWTNFGVWLMGRGTFYPAGLDGLLASYVAGIPFLRTMLLGNLVLVPAAAGIVALVERFERSHALGPGLDPARSAHRA